MSRCFLAVLLAGLTPLFAQSKAEPNPPQEKHDELKKQRTAPPTSEKEEIPPEEDAGLTATEYSFNPLQSKKDVQTGDFYFKKKSYLAAAGRYKEATKWDDGNSEAWLRLGETAEKLKDHEAARTAYKKYLDLAADSKNAPDIRKRLEKLK